VLEEAVGIALALFKRRSLLPMPLGIIAGSPNLPRP
jgi:hypothetical protein